MKEAIQTREQFIRFIYVGGINTAFGYSVYVFSIFVGFSYYVATFFSTCLGIIFNFTTTGTIVFKNKKRDLNLFLKFILTNIFLYLLRIECIRIINLFASNMYLSGFAAIIPISILTFFLNRKVFL